MKAIILAAGYATRLYPLTKDTPKPLLSVGGKALLAHILEKVHHLPLVDEIVIVTNQRFYPQFQQWLAGYPRNAQRITLLNDGTQNNEDRLGALGDIVFALSALPDHDDVLVVAGDNLFDFSLTDFLQCYHRTKSPLVALYDLQDKQKAAQRYGVAEVDIQQKLIGFEEKPAVPKSSLASTACYLFPAATLHQLQHYRSQYANHDNLGDFIRWLVENDTVYGFQFTGMWYDIGTPDQLEEAHQLFLKRK